VVFAGMSEDSKAEIAVHVNPLVFWVWIGAAIMVLGSIVALWPDKAVGSR
jgi:cytochrome c biogenesis factor